ncbi:MAG: hypothetical protein Q7S46_03950, partial [Gallionella sp.]|nr:hypothetical protein [Gallionella sp.]
LLAIRLGEPTTLAKSLVMAKPAVCGSGCEAAIPAPDASQRRVMAATYVGDFNHLDTGLHRNDTVFSNGLFNPTRFVNRPYANLLVGANNSHSIYLLFGRMNSSLPVS